ncbi:MAG TPA: Zn-ribbon domain-containing OB-fold protein [Desulfurococcaceae archaeon]|nr:Zn-ribbon domain-containing OB-fold protein [Desulfurococcaceae archaeon]
MMVVESVPRYWRERKYRYRLIGSECKKCGKRYYPPRRVCLNCGSRELVEVKLVETGKVVSYTVIRVPPKEFQGLTPYVIALIELDDGTRLLSQLTDVAPEEVSTGMKVVATFRRVKEQSRDGIIEYGIKFKPI